MPELSTRFSNSKVKTFLRCKNKYRYKYVMGLRPKRKVVQLERGSWIHELLMVHYDGNDWRARHKELTKEFYNLFEEERDDLGDLPGECGRIMKAYLRRYREEDKQYRVVDSELDEIVTLPNGLQLNVIVDLVLEDRRGRLWIVDHKTRKNFSDHDSMLLDPQLSLYYWAMEEMGYRPLAGALYNEIRTKPPTIPKQLKSGGLSKAKNIDTDVYTYMSEIRRLELNPEDYRDILIHIGNQPEKFFRRVPMPKDRPMLKTMVSEFSETARDIRRAERRGRFQRNFIPQDCKWSCEFKDMCIAELHGGNIDTMIRTDFTVSKRRKRGEEDIGEDSRS